MLRAKMPDSFTASAPPSHQLPNWRLQPSTATQAGLFIEAIGLYAFVTFAFFFKFYLLK